MSGSEIEAWQAAKYATNAAHEAMNKALGCTASDHFALGPFAPMQVDGEWYIGCNPDTVNFEAELLLISANGGTMRFMQQGAVGFFGSHDDQPVKLYTNGIRFALDWIAARRAFWEVARQSPCTDFEAIHAPHMPGMAMVGGIDEQYSLADIMGATTIEIDNPRLVNPLGNALLRAARLPVVIAQPARLRAVK